MKVYRENFGQETAGTICIPYYANAIIFASLTLVGILGFVTFLLLRSSRRSGTGGTQGQVEEGQEESPAAVSDSKPLINETQTSLTATDRIDPSLPPGGVTTAMQKKSKLFKQAWKDFLRSFRLMFTVRMFLLIICFIYTGLELTFWSGVFGTLVGRTLQHPEYVGLVGLVIGIGEIVGGAIFGIFGKHTRRFGRDPIVILGMILHMVSFLLIFYTIPNNATKTLHPDDTTFLIDNKNVQLGISVTVAFFLGFGDSCFNTQIYSFLGDVYKGQDGAPAMAIFKFFQSIFACIAFLYNGHMDLMWQLLILVVFGVAGTVGFVLAEWGVGSSRAAPRGIGDKDE